MHPYTPWAGTYLHQGPIHTYGKIDYKFIYIEDNQKHLYPWLILPEQAHNIG